MTDQYITLVASVKSDTRTNTSSRFVTRLPQTLHLSKDRHRIGLVEILFPNTIENLPLGASATVKYKTIDGKKKDSVYIKVPAGHYEKPEHLLEFLNVADSGTRFTYQKETGHFKIHIDDSNVDHIYIPSDTAYFLGFEKTVVKKTSEANYRLDLFNNTSVLYIYSDIVAPSIMGDTRANLLQCCPISGNFGEMNRQAFNPVRYTPILFDTIDSISIEILNEQGQPVKFSYGSVILTLHIVHV